MLVADGSAATGTETGTGSVTAVAPVDWAEIFTFGRLVKSNGAVDAAAAAAAARAAAGLRHLPAEGLSGCTVNVEALPDTGVRIKPESLSEPNELPPADE